MQPEARLHKKIQALIKRQGGTCFKIHGGDNPFQAVGIPDLLCCIRGRFVGIEVKLPGEPLRAAQVVQLAKIYKAGGVAAIVESVEQARSLLSNLKQGGNPEVPTLFDRGTFTHVWGKGPKRS
jgi:hypothetical protein